MNNDFENLKIIVDPEEYGLGLYNETVNSLKKHKIDNNNITVYDNIIGEGTNATIHSADFTNKYSYNIFSNYNMLFRILLRLTFDWNEYEQINFMV